MTITKKITFTPKQEQIETLYQNLLELTKYSKQEQGCLFYYLFKDSSNFIILEAWENSSYLEAHKQTKHFNHFKSIASSLIDSKLSEEWDFIL